MRKLHFVAIITSFLTIGEFCLGHSAEVSPGFLTLPFPEGAAHLSEGWVYETPGPNPFSPECGYRCHKGTDYGAFGVSFPILPASPGQAIASRSKSYGNIVLIAHDEIDASGLRYYSLYAHLRDGSSDIIVRKDLDEVKQDIARGDFSAWTPVDRSIQIGLAGKTGTTAFNVHLHFEIQRGGYAQHKTDPYDLYDARSLYPGSCTGAYLWLACPPRSPVSRATSGTFSSGTFPNNYCNFGTAPVTPNFDLMITSVDFWAACYNGRCVPPNTFRVYDSDGSTLLAESDGGGTFFGYPFIAHIKQTFSGGNRILLRAGHTYRVTPYSYNGQCGVNNIPDGPKPIYDTFYLRQDF